MCCWAKDSGLTKVFGAFGKPDETLYIDALPTVSAIQDGKSSNITAPVNGRGYIVLTLRYKTILITAQIFL